MKRVIKIYDDLVRPYKAGGIETLLLLRIRDKNAGECRTDTLNNELGSNSPLFSFNVTGSEDRRKHFNTETN